MEQTIKHMAEMALLSQGACNLSGIVHSFSNVMTHLRKLYPEQSTEFYNTHPIAVLYATQIAYLTGCNHSTAYTEAHRECERLAKE